MALDNFTGQNIQDTYQRVVQTHGGNFADGTGSAISIVTADQTASLAFKLEITGAFHAPSASISTRLATLEATEHHIHAGTYSSSLQTLGNITSSGNISASGQIVASNFSGTTSGTNTGDQSLVHLALTSSISGAFTSISSSFSERISTNEIVTAKTLISSSAQIKDDISGSFNVVSHSLQSRLTTAESELGNTLISGSAQIKDDISGSFNTVSHSLQSRIVTTVTNTTTNSNNITLLTNATSSYLLNTTDTLTGDLTVTGIITAEEFHTEFVTSSVIFASGSSRIGNSTDDVHQFTGSVFISGSSIRLNGVDLLPFTATSISGSFNAASHSLQSRLTTTETELNNTLISSSVQIKDDISGSLGTNATLIRSLTATGISGSLGTNATLIRSLSATKISGSFNALSSSFSTRVTDLESTSADRTFNNITASGDVSASGLLFISASTTSSTLNTLMYDTATGQVYYTGSYGGGGGGGGGGTGAGFPFSGSAIITGSLVVSGSTNNQDAKFYADILPGENDEYTLGTSATKWNAVFATNTFFGGIHEINLETTGISKLQTGTVLVSKAGQMVPCDTKGDALVMGVVTSGSDYPIIMGAEPVLIDGPVYEGDYIITSNRVGYGAAVPPDQIYEQKLFGKIIAQSLETNLSGGSIKAMIRKM